MRLYDYKGRQLPQKRKGHTVPVSVCAWLALWVGVVTFSAGYFTGRPAKPSEITLTGGGVTFSPVGTISIDTEATGFSQEFDVDDPVIEAVFDESLRAWSRALGRTIERPRLLRGYPGIICGPIAFACASRWTNTIRLVNIPEHVHLRNILMHEIGHVLGVPHIEGDALMNAEYKDDGKLLSKPTASAVALARLAQAGVR